MYRKSLAVAAAVLAAQVAWGQNPNTLPKEQNRAQREVNQAQRELNRSQQQQEQAERDLNRARENQNRVQQSQSPSVVVQDEQSLDAQIAQCLILGNDHEIEICQFGAQNSQDPRVRELAQKLVTDHQQLNQKLQRFSGRVMAATTGNPRQQDARDGNSSGQETTALQIDRNGVRIENRGANPERVTVHAGYAPRENAMLQIARETAQNCTKLTKEALQKEQGKDFDLAFLGQQCGEHIGMQAHLTAVENHVSPELRQVVQDARQSVQSHRQQIDQLMGQIKSPATNR